jgi:riboflavin kinase/FMN adenylyltransferase
MSLATQLLGRDYAITGRVVHGRKLGRTLGFPTMNLRLSRALAITGVFAVLVRGLSDIPLLGVANVGVKPTLKDTASQQSLEVHLFDWQQAVYGCLIEVVFCHRIRSEQSFDSLAALTAQIAQDKQDALIWHQAALASV